MAIAVQAAVSAGCFAEVIVVAGAVSLVSVVPESVRVIENPDWASGQASSLTRSAVPTVSLIVTPSTGSASAAGAGRDAP